MNILDTARLGVTILRQKFVRAGATGIAELDGVSVSVGVTEDGVGVIDESLNKDDVVGGDAVGDDV